MVVEKASWLASYPKSGNTWVRMFLGAYALGALDINSNATRTSYDCDKYAHNALSPFPLNEVEPEVALFLRHSVILHLIARSKYRPIIIKTHCANTCVHDVELIPGLLTAGAVYVVRDPRDVVASFAKHTGSTIDIAIAHMNEPQNRLHQKDNAITSWLDTWSNHVNSWDKPGLIRVRYEDILTHPEAQFARVLEGFGMKVNKPRVGKAVRLCAMDKMKKQEAKAGFIENGKQTKFFGQGKGWKNELTESQVRKIEIDHGETMEKLGYKLEYL